MVQIGKRGDNAHRLCERARADYCVTALLAGCHTQQRLQEENEAEEELLDAIATALTVVLKRFGDAAMPYVDGLMPSVGSLLVCRSAASALTHGAMQSANLRSTFLPVCGRYVVSACWVMRHNCGRQEAGRSEEERRIGICVMDDILEHSPTGGAQIAVQALPILLNSSQAKARLISLSHSSCAAPS